jgi:hypothetical protein
LLSEKTVRARKLEQLALIGAQDRKKLNPQHPTSKSACIISGL